MLNSSKLVFFPTHFVQTCAISYYVLVRVVFPLGNFRIRRSNIILVVTVIWHKRVKHFFHIDADVILVL